jgi:hypothetical protein
MEQARDLAKDGSSQRERALSQLWTAREGLR